jgi:hypothetical protein
MIHTRLTQYCCWKPSRKLPALYMRLGNHVISTSDDVLSIFENMHWSNSTIPELEVTAENEPITSLSIVENQIACTRRALLFMCATPTKDCWSAGPRKSRSEVQVREICCRDEPGEIRSEVQVKKVSWRAEPGKSRSEVQVREICWRAEPGRSRSVVQVREVCWKAEPGRSTVYWMAELGRSRSEVQVREVCWRAELRLSKPVNPQNSNNNSCSERGDVNCNECEF